MKTCFFVGTGILDGPGPWREQAPALQERP